MVYMWVLQRWPAWYLLATVRILSFTLGAFPIRWFVPPAMFAVSMKYFLPKTSENLCEYYEQKEHHYAPEFSDARRSQWEKVQQHWYTGVDHLKMTGEKLRSWFSTGVQDVQKSTGLQISSLLPQEAKTLPEKVATPKDAGKKII